MLLVVLSTGVLVATLVNLVCIAKNCPDEYLSDADFALCLDDVDCPAK